MSRWFTVSIAAAKHTITSLDKQYANESMRKASAYLMLQGTVD